MLRAYGHTLEQQDDLTEKFEELFRRSMRKMVDRFVALVEHRAMTADAGPTPTPPPTPPPIGPEEVFAFWQSEVDGVLAQFIEEVFRGGGLELARKVARSTDLVPLGQGVVGLPASYAADYVSSVRNQMVNVADSTWQQIRTELAAGTDLGESIPKLADRVRQAGIESEARALATARTTVVGASNTGSFAQASLLGGDEGVSKGWEATEDARTRPDHRVADGQTVPLMSTFTVGGYSMLHPGDESAPASEVVNCRCTVVYLFDEDSSVATCDGGENCVTDPDRRSEMPEAITAADLEPMEDTVETDGDDDSDADVAAEQTGAMIALVPSPADIARLALPGGEAPEDLHLTLLYLGDAANFDSAARQAIVTSMTELVLMQPALAVTGFGAALWNPLGEDPAVVLNVGGEGLQEARWTAESATYGATWDCDIPEQHEPWSPHVCLAYSSDASTLAAAVEKVGPILFDRVRIAFAGVNVDLPLVVGDPVMMAGDTVALALDSPAPTGDATPEDQGVGGTGNTNLPSTTFEGGEAWDGILVVEGVQTGDGRMFGDGSLDWPTGGLPLSWARENLGEHLGSVIVGRIDEVWRDAANPAVIRGRGVFDTGSPEGAEAFRQVGSQFLKGISVDVDSVSDADVELVFPPSDGGEVDPFAAPELIIFNRGRIRGATLCAIPAFVEAQINLVGQGVDMADAQVVPAPADAPAVSGSATAATSDGEWLAARHMSRLAPSIPLGMARQAFAYVDSSGERGGMIGRLAGRLLHHEVDQDGTIGPANLTACASAVGSLLTNARLGIDLSARRAAYEHLAGHLRAGGLTPQTFSNDGLSDEVAAIYASATKVLAPPDYAFEDPHFTQKTPITITESEDGEWQLFRGHGATWDTCHISYPGACTVAPREGHHDFYRLGEVVTASGNRIAVGTVTMGTGHAPTNGVDPRRAAEHYDNTGSVVAIVASGEDNYGIWVAGVVKPGVPAGRLMELRAAKLSGDWRRIGGVFRLVAMLAVNVPGFPVPRVGIGMANGQQVSLVAAGIVPDAASIRAAEERIANRAAVQALAAKLQKRVGRDPKSLANALRTRVHGGR